MAACIDKSSGNARAGRTPTQAAGSRSAYSRRQCRHQSPQIHSCDDHFRFSLYSGAAIGPFRQKCVSASRRKARTGVTIRNVSRGVIGIAVVQTLLAGVGLILGGVPAAGLISFVVLLLAIIQIGPAIILLPIVVWSWFAMDTGMAALFSVYMIVVGLLDNILRPLVMAKGLGTPMPVILVGVFGGTLAHGMIGLFVGPIVLSIAWQLLALWFRDESQDPLVQPAKRELT